MDALLFDPTQDYVQVQDEPALEIALPQVFTKPDLTAPTRGKLPHVELLVERLYHTHLAHNGTSALGPDYQALVNEFQPLFTWAIACWDYLLSTEGCRFVLRHGEEKLYTRGDYRAILHTDFSRLVHRIFRECVIAFAQSSPESSFTAYLRTHFWDAVLQAYRTLEEPQDPRQRNLTAYSYLRCSPYHFLNDFHHDLVHHTLQKLPTRTSQATTLYFLNFFTIPAAAQAMNLPIETLEETLRQGLRTLLLEDRLVYCLLRQIERY